MEHVFEFVQRVQEIKQELELGNVAKAIEALSSMVEKEDCPAEVFLLLAKAYEKIGQVSFSIDVLRKGVARGFQDLGIKGNLAFYLGKKGQWTEAVEIYQSLLAEYGESEQLWNQLGSALEAISSYEKAQNAFLKALDIDPLFLDARMNLAHVYHKDGQIEKAQEQYSDLACYFPNSFFAKWGMGASFPVVYESTEEIAEYRKKWKECLEDLLNLDPTNEFYEEGLKVFLTKTNFYLHYQAKNDKELQELYGKLLHKVVGHCFPQFIHKKTLGNCTSRRMRVGFVSSYFCTHSIYKTHGAWITRLNNEQFETFVFYLGEKKDEASEAIRQGAKHYFTGSQDPEFWMQTIQDQELDVLIYPDIGMHPLTQVLAATRLAPVQCVSHGHPVTTGLPTIDYCLSSDLMEPNHGQEHYTESLVRLPDLASVYPEPVFEGRRREHCEDGRAVYVNLQSLFKLLPEHDCVYPMIAKACSHARFHFIDDLSEKWSERFRKRLEKNFQEYGLKMTDYCRFSPYLSEQDFRNLILSADVVLDNLAWSGFNTCIEALSLNKPVITKSGDSCRTKHSDGVLKLIGMEELVTDSLEEFVDKAVRLGTDKLYWTEMQERIMHEKHKMFAGKRFIKELEAFLLGLLKK